MRGYDRRYYDFPDWPVLAAEVEALLRDDTVLAFESAVEP